MATIIFIPTDAIISCMSAYTLLIKCTCPTIQNGIDKFCDIQTIKYFKKPIVYSPIVSINKNINHPQPFS